MRRIILGFLATAPLAGPTLAEPDTQAPRTEWCSDVYARCVRQIDPSRTLSCRTYLADARKTGVFPAWASESPKRCRP